MKKVTLLTTTAILLSLAGGMITEGKCYANTEDTSLNTSALIHKDNEVIQFKDQNLSKQVKVALGLSEGEEITKNNILELTELRTKQANIEDLTGLEYAENLKIVTFNSEKISSLAPLENLKSLYSVGIPGSQNIPMSEVLKLKNITELELSNISYTPDEFNKLSSYKNMTWLVLNNCGLNDISFIKDMNELEILQVDSNNLQNLDSVNNNNLARLSAINNKITELKGIKGTQLEELRLSNNQISEVDLSNTPNISVLNLNNNNISNLSFKDLQHLRYLTVNDNKLEEVSFDNLPDLQDIYLKNNNLKSLEALSELSALNRLDLTKNVELKNISFLSNMPELTFISLEECSNVEDLSSLSSLSKIDTIYLNNMGLTDTQVNNIGTLESLYAVGMSGNFLTDASFVKQFPNIYGIELERNSISDLSSLPEWVEYYSAIDQKIQLPDNKVDTPFQIKLNDTENNLPNISNWVGEGILKDLGQGIQQLSWTTPGDNSFSFISNDEKFSGVVTQKVLL